MMKCPICSDEDSPEIDEVQGQNEDGAVDWWCAACDAQWVASLWGKILEVIYP
jgi:hypothetical protein